jgi:hypothetical protein
VTVAAKHNCATSITARISDVIIDIVWCVAYRSIFENHVKLTGADAEYGLCGVRGREQKQQIFRFAQDDNASPATLRVLRGKKTAYAPLR